MLGPLGLIILGPEATETCFFAKYVVPRNPQDSYLADRRPGRRRHGASLLVGVGVLPMARAVEPRHARRFRAANPMPRQRFGLRADECAREIGRDTAELP